MSEASFLLSFGGGAAHISYEGQLSAGLASLFGGLVPASRMAPAEVRFCIRDEEHALSLWCNDSVVLRRASGHDALQSLVSLLAQHLIEPCTSGLMLHAAAVGRGGRAVLLPGAAFAGKSTLTAWLLSRGFDYLTDELVYVPRGETTVRGLGGLCMFVLRHRVHSEMCYHGPRKLSRPMGVKVTLYRACRLAAGSARTLRSLPSCFRNLGDIAMRVFAVSPKDRRQCDCSVVW